MLSERHRTVFVHVPKTAGQSVEHVFLDLLGLTWEQRDQLLLRPNQDPTRGPPMLAHLRASQYVELGYVTPQQWSSWFTFGFVRNPFDRLVSEYRYRGANRRHTFPRWVERVLGDADGTGSRMDEWTDLADHLAPQSTYLLDREGTQLVDVVGRYERLAEDFAGIARRIGLPTTELPHRNSSDAADQGARSVGRVRQAAGDLLARRHTQDHWSAYYDDATIDRVSAVYADDLTKFDYAFEHA